MKSSIVIASNFQIGKITFQEAEATISDTHRLATSVEVAKILAAASNGIKETLVRAFIPAKSEKEVLIQTQGGVLDVNGNTVSKKHTVTAFTRSTN